MPQTKRSSSTNKRKTSSSKKQSGNRKSQDDLNEDIVNEITIIIIVALAVLLFLCNIQYGGESILGAVGSAVSDFMFGLLGIVAYVFPIALCYMLFFGIANKGNPKALRRNFSISFILIAISMIGEMVSNFPNVEGEFMIAGETGVYGFASSMHKGGGLIGGSLCFLSVKGLGKVGTIFLIIILILICLLLITGKSLFKGAKKIKDSSVKAIEYGTRDYDERERRREERAKEKEDRREKIRSEKEEKQQRVLRMREAEKLKRESEEDEKLLSVSGVTTYSFVKDEVSSDEVINQRDDIHEINLNDQDFEMDFSQADIPDEEYMGENDSITEIKFSEEPDSPYHESLEDLEAGAVIPGMTSFDEEIIDVDSPAPIRKSSVSANQGSIFNDRPHEVTNGGRTFGTASGTASDIAPVEKKIKKIPYKKPPIDLLIKGKVAPNGERAELMSTARKLEEVLASFNVRAKVTSFSQGPAVTRYEMSPETGVKVSKILSLSDDLKLNLAASDIRIEAPIPGKAAIGIEVPNKESSSVALRDLIESKEFKASESKLSFAVGKDLAGKVVVTDIAKMPHMLIAGATGSGKSVCINTLIMSILYKATPDEVKLIMIDPKVVELSVYNGIPHLLIPVVTDPKKANASLQWAVKEMDDRYQKFAEYGVRDLKGYNTKIEGELDVNNNPVPKMYQLVVIVDELADLMMVAGKEVEESICRLAQLARAAGIHLIIATQRPSVDVITGLIKANMPSRVAFSVSSQVDSRTILDMGGAEKLLGKGDMLFYPQGYTKPARVQGAFVSDKEVSDVVDFLKKGGTGEYSNSIEEKILSMSANSGSSNASLSSAGADAADGQDEFFAEAGRLITESGKSSIGMLQRKFKIGFNRAARIMDALSDAGVVGPEEGTKPRTILMSPEEFENYLQNM